MELKIGTTIQSLRKQKNLTQEQVADTLGVSTAAVSKWETGSTYPDILLLSPLARLLGTDVDHLLNFRVTLTQEEIAGLTDKMKTFFEQGSVEEGIEYCQNKMKEYPTDLRLKFCIASLYMRYAAAVLDEEFTKGQMIRAKDLYEQCLDSEDQEIRESSLYVLSGLYMMTEEPDKALEVLECLPCPDYDVRMMKSNILIQKGEMEEAIKLEQISLWHHLRNSCLNIYNLAGVARKQGDLEKSLQLIDMVIQLTEVTRIEKLDLMNSNFYLFKAEVLSIMGEPLEALKALEMFGEAYHHSMLKENKDMLCFDALEFGGESALSYDYLKRNARFLIQENEHLEPLHKFPEFQTILEKLEK